MALIVSDTNIFIDMDVAGLIRTMFQLPEVFAVPDVLYEEELREHHAELPTYGLRVLEIRPEYTAEAVRLRTHYRKPGQNDLFALALALQENCPLLTGDARLREAAEAENVAVFGTLWLIEHMFNEGLVSIKQVKAAYQKMEAENRRLPWDLVKQQLRKFESG